MSVWDPIATAPDLERIWVCGWQERNGNTIGYWWWHEDVAQNGCAIEYPDATHWCAIELPPFPDTQLCPRRAGRKGG